MAVFKPVCSKNTGNASLLYYRLFTPKSENFGWGFYSYFFVSLPETLADDYKTWPFSSLPAPKAPTMPVCAVPIARPEHRNFQAAF